MSKLAPEAYSLLPRLDDTFFLVRAISFAGLGVWAIVAPTAPLGQMPALILLGAFGVHLWFFLFSISRGWVSSKALHYSTLAFDLVFISLLTRFTGGFDSPFYVLFYLLLPFATIRLGFRAGLITALAASGSYLAAGATAPGTISAGPLVLRLVILWVFTSGSGYYAKFSGQSEKRLLNALDKLNERTTELERAHRRLELVYEASRDLGTILKVDDLTERVLWISRNLFGFPRCELLLWDQNKKRLFLHGRVQNVDTVIFSQPRPVRMTPFFKVVLEVGDARRNANRRQDRPGSRGKDTFRSQLAVPMIFQGKTTGILNAESPKINAFGEREEHVFAILANSAAMALENVFLHQKMEQLTISDELTDIFNYRHFKTRLEDEKKRSVRYGQPLSLIMIDIDWFKRFNDTYGHETGNRLLKRIVRVISGCIRDVDILARYGGEEFMVILPQTGQAEAYKIGERIRKGIAEARFEVGANGEELARVTVSVGISTYPENGRPEDELVESVDQALYRAKGAGKNLVCTV